MLLKIENIAGNRHRVSNEVASKIFVQSRECDGNSVFILQPTLRRRALTDIPPMREDYIKGALKMVDDPNILVNLVSLRVKQLKRGNRPLVESLEKLSPEDTALREIMEGKISYELATNLEAHGNR